MKKRTVYIAADGHEFETEEECYKYELNQCRAQAQIHAFNAQLEPLDWCTQPDYIQFIYFKNFNSINIFNNVMDDIGYSSIPCFREEKFVAWWEWNEITSMYQPLEMEVVYNRYMALKALYDKCIEIEGEESDGK